MGQRIVIAHGHLDGEAATRLCAQLLTLDAEGDDPIRLELQGIDADLSAALTVMGVLDTVRVPVTAYAAGRASGPGLGVLAAATRRLAYPNAVFALSEPRVSFDGPVTALAAQEEQVRIMLGELFGRLAEATGREGSEIRADARQGRLLTAPQAVEYGLVDDVADAHARPPGPGGPGFTPGGS
jgi:ATP-dependent Clp protease protease subunit